MAKSFLTPISVPAGATGAQVPQRQEVDTLLAAKSSIANTYQVTASKATFIATDTNLQTWADSLPASGIYDTNLTVAQDGLPAGWWYIEFVRHSNDNAGNLYHTLTATSLTGASGIKYCNTRTNASWGGWVQMATATGGGGTSWEFPVGHVLIDTSNINPSTWLGYGTWTAFGDGRVLVGIDTTQTEFDTLGEVGGAKTHTLAVSEMPSHTHIQNQHTHIQNAHTHTQDPHSHTIQIASGTNGSQRAGGTSNATLNGNPATTTVTATNQATTATNQATTATNQNTGGDGAHNNLQPYIVVKFWKRTA